MDRSRGVLPANLAAGDSELVEQLQLAPQLRTGDFTSEQLAILPNRLFHLRGRFVKEFDSEMAHAQGKHSRNIIRAGLRQRVEDGVAASDIRLDRVLHAHAVAQFQIVAIARAAAVRVVRAGREKGAEDAILHVKHRNMLVNGDFEPFGRRSLQQRFELQEIQIV